MLMKLWYAIVQELFMVTKLHYMKVIMHYINRIGLSYAARIVLH